MARSRPKYRRSASQRAASLLALALPAPLARAADTRLGPLIMFIGIPAMIIFGLLQVNWQNGTPRLTINQDKAHELCEAAKNQLSNLDAQGRLQHLEQTAVNAWNAAHSQTTQPGHAASQYATTNYGSAGYGAQTNGQTSATSMNSQSAFPSTKPPTPTGYSSSQISNAYGSSNQANALTYQQQQQQLQQQQLYQQQVYEQQLYQQQLYEQQLRQQQLQSQQQWQSQTNPSYTQQYDQYGRSLPAPAGYTTPNSVNTQGSLPTNNFGRY